MTFGVTQALPSYRIENLIQVVDANLYYGKEHGKNQVVSEIPKS
jgi:PleD family two-component response regulator